MIPPLKMLTAKRFFYKKKQLFNFIIKIQPELTIKVLIDSQP